MKRIKEKKAFFIRIPGTQNPSPKTIKEKTKELKKKYGRATTTYVDTSNGENADRKGITQFAQSVQVFQAKAICIQNIATLSTDPEEQNKIVQSFKKKGITIHCIEKTNTLDVVYFDALEALSFPLLFLALLDFGS